MQLERRDLLLWGGALLLLAVALVRVAVPDRSRMRRLSINAIDIKTEPIGAGETLAREGSWAAPEDIYVVGWNYFVGAPDAAPTVALLHGSTRLFVASGVQAASNGLAYPPGSGYFVKKGDVVRLAFRITNRGAAGETHGASALVYFVPVEGN